MKNKNEMTLEKLVDMYSRYGWNAKHLEDLNKARIANGYPELFPVEKKKK